MRIFEEDNEEVKQGKREINEREMAKDHQRGALLLPLGVPERCKVEQPRDFREITLGVGSGGYPKGENMVRVRLYDGYGKGYYGMSFCGCSHAAFMSGIKRDQAGLNIGNFDSETQSLRRSRPNRKRRTN